MDVVSARALLGVSRSADADQVKRAFRRLARSAHPDRGGTSDAFQRLADAQRVALAAIPAPDSGRPSTERWLNGVEASAASGVVRPGTSRARRRTNTVPPSRQSTRTVSVQPTIRFGDVLAREIAAA